ncbi:DUF4340 domain-containing protein, partial [Candidatus Dependentiae bacterium]|nr:DUF4340 domain-containing protein [Candidatus Dependentiae bacterium]
MMKKKILISGIIFICLAILLFIDVKINEPSEKMKDNWLIKINWEELSSIKISTTLGNLEFYKIQKEWFVVKDKRYPADKFKIEALINSLSVLRKNKILLKEEYEDKSRFSLDNPPVILELKTKQETVKLFFGTRTSVKEEVYTMFPDDDNIYLTNSYILIRLFWGLTHYRDKFILKYNPDEVVNFQLAYSGSGIDIEVIKETGSWKIIKPVKTPISADIEYVKLMVLGGVSLEGVKVFDDMESLNNPDAFKNTRFSYTVIDKNNKKYKLDVGSVNIEHEAYYVKGTEDFPIYLVPIEIMNRIIISKYRLADKWIVNPDVNKIPKNIVSISFINKRGTTSLVRKSKGRWFLNDNEVTTDKGVQLKLINNLKAFDVISFSADEFCKSNKFDA